MKKNSTVEDFRTNVEGKFRAVSFPSDPAYDYVGYDRSRFDSVSFIFTDDDRIALRFWLWLST